MPAPTLFVVIGLPGSGKTFRGRQIVAATNAVLISADDWVVGLGMSLLDYEFRPKLQNCLLLIAQSFLERGVSVVLEFGSWHREERARILAAGLRVGAVVELHFLDAPIAVLEERVRSRGRTEDEALIRQVLPHAAGFERPDSEETAAFARYFGPSDAWP